MTPVIIRAKSGKRQRNGEFPNRRAIHWQKATVMKSERLQERIRKDRFSNSEKKRQDSTETETWKHTD